MALTQVDQGLLSSTAQYTGFKNRLINSAMVIDQRNAGASVTPTSSSYTLDRWYTILTQSSKFSVRQNAGSVANGGSVVAPAGFTNWIGVTSLAATSLAAGDYFLLTQSIEGFNTADFGFGTANASTVTLSFWVRSSLTGTFGGSLVNSGFSRSYPFTYTISAANTWEQKTVTIAGDTTGTWIGATNGIGLRVQFGLGVGSTYSGTAGSWAATEYDSATGATSVVGTNGATFYITGIQLEKGSTATSFDYRPIGTELQLAQRYCYVIPASSYYNFVAQAYTTTRAQGYLLFPVTMRSAPTLTNPTLTGATTYAANGAALNITALVTVGGNSVNGAFFDITVASGLTAGSASLVYQAPTGGVTVLSAEL
jgi:hypothetical protein